MARRAGVIEQIQETNATVFVFDTGSVASFDGDNRYLATNLSFNVMSQLQYDAISITADDLHYGFTKFKHLAKDAKIKHVSTNIVSQIDKKHISKPFLIIERNGIKIGVLSLCNQNLLTSKPYEYLSQYYVAVDPLIALESVLPNLQSQVDIVVLLTDLGIPYLTMLANNFPGLNYIITQEKGNGNPSQYSPLEKTTPPYIMYTGKKGFYIISLTFQKGDSYPILKDFHTFFLDGYSPESVTVSDYITSTLKKDSTSQSIGNYLQ